MQLLDGYLRRPELAKELRVSERTIARWEVARRGPPRVTVGRTILYKTESVRQWLEEREQRQGRRVAGNVTKPRPGGRVRG